MWRSILARQRCAILRNYNAAYASPIQVPLSNFITNPTQSTVSSSLGSPQLSNFPNVINNPRFFSQQIATENEVPVDSHSSQNEDGTVHLVNDDVSVQNDEYSSVEVVEEEETEAFQIDDDKLEKVVSLLQSSADGSFESSLDNMNLTIRQDFVIKAIESIETVLGENLVRFFKWAWSENSHVVTTQVLESFVITICNSGRSIRDKDVYSLWDLVNEIGEKEFGVINVTILNELVSSFSKLGKGKAALGVFEKFEGFQCVPDADTYYFTIEALSRRSDFDLAWSVCQKMLDAQIIPDGEKIGRILSWLCKGEKAKAHAVYMAAVENKRYPPLSSVNFLASHLCHKNETVPLALEVLNDIPVERRKRAIKPFSAVVRALCRVKDVDAAKQLVLKMIADGPLPGNAVFNYVITGYSKAGEIEQAVEILRLLESRGLKPDVYSYSVIASAYSNGGEMEQARKILEEAKKNHLKLSPVMYHTLIRGYCKLERFDEALELLSEMKDFGVRASADEYEKLIQSLCLKALDWERAEKLQEEMKEKGLYLKGITRALVRAVKETEKEAVEAQSGSLVA